MRKNLKNPMNKQFLMMTIGIYYFRNRIKFSKSIMLSLMKKLTND